MEQYVIKGGVPLSGEVEIGGAKNAALAILAAAIMTDETVTIDNLPDVRDINVLLDAIAGIGAKVERIDSHTVKINGSYIDCLCVDYDSMKKIRASYYLLGALLGKYKEAEVALPGGAISEADRWICISKDLRHSVQAWNCGTEQLPWKQKSLWVLTFT